MELRQNHSEQLILNEVKQYQNKYLGLVAIAVLILIGSTTPVMTYASVVMSFVAACYFGYTFIKDPGPWAGKIIITILCLQNLCIGVGAHLAGNTDTSLMLLTQIPFMTIFVIWFTGLIYELKKDGFKKYISNKTNLLFILLLICIGMSLIIGHGSAKSCLVSLRNMTVFYMTYCIGRRMCKSREDMNDYIRYFLILSVIMCILGLILMAGGYEMYKALGVHEVYIAKGAPFAQGRLDDRFLRIIQGQWVQRLSSIYYEPVNIAYFLSTSVLCAAFANPFKNRKKKVLLIIVCIVGLLLTQGKGGYLLVIMPMCCLLGEWLIRKIFRLEHEKCSDSLLLFVMIIIAFVGLTIITILLVNFWDGRELIMPHIRGIVGAMNSITARPWGYGLGNGGNAALVFNGTIKDMNDWYAIGGETALMSFLYQLGICGIIVFMMCLVSTSLYKAKKIDNFSKIIYCLPWGLICVSVLQDNTFTPQCIVPFMLLVGGYRRDTKEDPLLLVRERTTG